MGALQLVGGGGGGIFRGVFHDPAMLTNALPRLNPKTLRMFSQRELRGIPK